MARQLDIIQIEQWKDVPNWPGYRVSSLGRVCGPRSMLRGHIGRFGYVAVPLSAKSKTYKHKVHRLVAAAFLGPCPDGMQVNHRNNIRDDNRLCNLEYVTPKQNSQHRKRHGTYPTGENNGRARLTETQVREIRRRRAAGESGASLAREFGVHRNTVWWIAKGETWVEV